MAKVYDPILCMMVDKPATRTTDAKGGKYEIYGDVVTLKSVTPATVKYETSNGFVQTIGRKKWDELAKKVNDAMDSKAADSSTAMQRYINAILTETPKMAEKFVRQAEQDSEISDSELSTIYKAYNKKHGKKFHDSKPAALDKAIRAIYATPANASRNRQALESIKSKLAGLAR